MHIPISHAQRGPISLSSHCANADWQGLSDHDKVKTMTRSRPRQGQDHDKLQGQDHDNWQGHGDHLSCIQPPHFLMEVNLGILSMVMFVLLCLKPSSNHCFSILGAETKILRWNIIDALTRRGGATLKTWIVAWFLPENGFQQEKRWRGRNHKMQLLHFKTSLYNIF